MSLSLKCGRVTTTPLPTHLSFDYTKQVHLLSFPMQPVCLYILIPRMFGIFGVCMLCLKGMGCREVYMLPFNINLI